MTLVNGVLDRLNPTFLGAIASPIDMRFSNSNESLAGSAGAFEIDNVSVVPEPRAALLFAIGVFVAASRRQKMVRRISSSVGGESRSPSP